MFAVAAVASLISNPIAGALASLGPADSQYKYLPIFTAAAILICALILIYSKSLSNGMFLQRF